MKTRDIALEFLEQNPVPEVLIVGAGINGTGVFRDLSAQGVPCLLVDKGDFSSGTSCAPSRLIHGGLRYLETGEAKLVKESLIERNLLLKNACHIVRPQPIWIPITSRFSGSIDAVARFLRLTTKPGPKGAVPVKIGLMFYDLFGRFFQSMPNHRMISRAKAISEMPVLADDVIAIGEYYDAFISHPERLVMELIQDAENDCGTSMAIPYMAMDQSVDGKVTLCDQISGKTYQIEPKIVINAAGAWVDHVQSGLGISGRLMGGTRGTHLVMEKPELTRALGGKMLYFETADFRACLILPLNDTQVYVGTTDIRVTSPDERYYTEDEIDYIFSVLKPVLPRETFDRSEIVFAMGGVRPLPHQDTDVTGQISRDHRIETFGPSENRPYETVTLVGGKWTTYRAFGEQVTDMILKMRQQPRIASTAERPIGGAKGFPTDKKNIEQWITELAQETGIDRARIKTLAKRYGSKARNFAKAEIANPAKFEHLTHYTPAEVMEICQNERITRLQDVVMRRTLMALEGDVSHLKLKEIGSVIAKYLQWDEKKLEQEIANTCDILITKFRVTLN